MKKTSVFIITLVVITSMFMTSIFIPSIAGNIMYGDCNGDGKIDAIDLLQVRKFMLGSHSLKGSYLSAGDTDRSGAVDAIDLLQVRKHMLGTYKIVQ